MSTHGSGLGAGPECEGRGACSGEELGEYASSGCDGLARLRGRSDSTDSVSEEALDMGFAGEWDTDLDFDGDGNGRVVGVTDTDLEKLDCFGTLIFNTSDVFTLVGTVTSEARPLTIGSS
jgi:hypothetical protein